MTTFFSRHFSAMIGLGLLLSVGLACGFKSDADWRKELGGKKLTMAKTSGAISDRVDIWFCSNGQYARETQFTGFSSGGGSTLSMAESDVELGNWQVENGVLILLSEKGESREYSLSGGNNGEVIRLDNVNYLVSRHSECN